MREDDEPSFESSEGVQLTSKMAVIEKVNGFRRRLLGAVVLNLMLKMLTFTMSTALTRLLAPSVSGLNFSLLLLFEGCHFLAREAVRNTAARTQLPKEWIERLAAASGSVARVPKTALVSEAAVRSQVAIAGRCIANCAALSLPLFALLCATAEVGGLCRLRRIPSLLAGTGNLHPSSGGQWVLPELIVLVSVAVMLVAEPVSALTQALDMLNCTVTAEFAALVMRLVVTLVLLGALGFTRLEAEDLHRNVILPGMNSQDAAKLCYALAIAAYSGAYTLAFILVWWWHRPGCHPNADRHRQSPLCVVRCALRDTDMDAVTPWRLVSVAGMWEQLRHHRALFHRFFVESALRLVLTEGERFALAILGSVPSKGLYDLIANLGSLVARLVFRVWEQACFARWSKDLSEGRCHDAAHLLHRMLRLSLLFSSTFVIFGPPLAVTFLRLMYTSRWASHEAALALQLYCWLLPLLAWNGLLEAFLRAASSPSELSRLQLVMVLESLVYIAACTYALRWWVPVNGSADLSVCALVVANVVNMTVRCVLSLAQLRYTSALRLSLTVSRVIAVVDVRLAVVWAVFGVLARMAAPLVVVVVLGPAYIAALLLMEEELRELPCGAVRWLRGRLGATRSRNLKRD